MDGSDTPESGGPATVPVAPLPIARPTRRPGPGLPAAAGWLLLLVACQVFLATAWFIAFGQQQTAMLAVVTVGTLVAAVTLSGCFLGATIREKLAVRAPDGLHVLLTLVLSAPLMIAVSEGTAWVVDAWRAAGLPMAAVEQLAFREIIDDLARHPLPFRVASLVVFVSFFPAVGEELFFRGFLGNGLVARWGLVRGVLLTSALFGAMHLNPIHAAGAAALGVVLHLVYLWSRSLLVPMLLHFANNGLCCVAVAVTRGGRWDLSTDGHVPPPLVLAAFAATAAVLYLSHPSRVRWVKADGSEWFPWFPSAAIPPAGADARPVKRRPSAVAVIAAAIAYLLFVGVVALELLDNGVDDPR